MIRRATAILFAVIALGAGVGAAWVALSVPRDIRAEALLKEAREHLEKGERDLARPKLEAIIKSFPRTDAAAEASWALFRLNDLQRRELLTRIERLEQEGARQVETLTAEREERAKVAEEREIERKRIEELEKQLAEATAPPKKKR